ncbi:hypothetical protein EE612_023219, partial [Oryza sativa]
IFCLAVTFNKFKGDDGRFMNGIADEPRGLLSLYNAAYLLVHDEPELEEAISFSRYHLKSMMQGNNLKHPLYDQIKRALNTPLPRTSKRTETLHYLSEYGQEEGHMSILLDLAKVEFNLLQGVHLKELKAISEYVCLFDIYQTNNKSTTTVYIHINLNTASYTHTYICK